MYPAQQSFESEPAVQLAVVRKGESPQLYHLEAEPFILGSGKAADLHLDAEQVEAEHARVGPAAEGGWAVIDLGSSSGTYIGGQRLEPGVATAWAPDETLRIGPFFMRWRLLRPPAATAGAPAAGTASKQEPGGVDHLDLTVEPAEITVLPGEQHTIHAEISNLGDHVDHFTVDLSGLPREWVSTSHEFLRLAPGAHASLPLTVHPPEGTATLAGEYPFQVIASSSARETEKVVVQGVVTIAAVVAFDAELASTRWRHAQPGRVRIENRGNTPLRLIVGGDDPAEALDFGEREAVALAPGAEATITLVAEARARPLLVRERVLPFTIVVRPESGAAQELSGELVVPARFSLGCLLVTALPLVVVAVVLAGISAGLIVADAPELAGDGQLQQPLQEYIEAGWEQDLEISALEGADEVWLAVMSEEAREVQQRWHASPTFPEAYVRAQWATGWAIDDLSFGNGHWLLVMSKATEPVSQSWQLARSFPESAIMERREGGYAISDLAYGNGAWAVVMTRGPESRPQRWTVAPAFPQAFVREQWSAGYAVSDVAYGDGRWVVVVSQAERAAAQAWETSPTFPADFVAARWREGYDISTVARGRDAWSVVMTQVPETERRQTWQAAETLR